MVSFVSFRFGLLTLQSKRYILKITFYFIFILFTERKNYCAAQFFPIMLCTVAQKYDMPSGTARLPDGI